MYNIWNYDYIQQQAQQQYHQNQVFQVVDTARKLQDFLDSADKVDPQYKEAMTAECCAVHDCRVLRGTAELCQKAWYYIKTGVIYGIDH